MTPSELKRLYESVHPGGHFFTRSSMKFFGDTMANYGVQKWWHAGAPCWRLYRKRPVKHGLCSAHLFTLDGQHLGTE